MGDYMAYLAGWRRGHLGMAVCDPVFASESEQIAHTIGMLDSRLNGAVATWPQVQQRVAELIGGKEGSHGSNG